MAGHKTNSTANLSAVESVVPSIATGCTPPDASAGAPRALVTLTAQPSVDRAYRLPTFATAACRAASLSASTAVARTATYPYGSYTIGFGRSLTR